MSEDQAVTTFRKGLLKWSETNLREFPWRETTNIYEILIAELLLQRTDANKVKSVYERFLDRYPDIQSLESVSTEDIAELLRPLGLQNKRAEAIIEIASEYSDTELPRAADELQTLPFIGKYSANAVLCFGKGRRLPVVDRNVIRIYERAFGLDLHYRESETWEFAEEMLPNQDFYRYNLALLDFANAVCTATSPNCRDCFFSAHCEYFNKN